MHKIKTVSDRTLKSKAIPTNFLCPASEEFEMQGIRRVFHFFSLTSKDEMS